jgi:hypothetical protein
MKFFYVIVTCSGRKDDLISSLKESPLWDNILITTDIGNEKQTNVPDRSYNEEDHLLTVNVTDEYDMRPFIVLHAYQYIQENMTEFDFTHLVKLNDKDTRVNQLDKLDERLLTQPEFGEMKEPDKEELVTHHYIGERIQVKVNPTFHYKVVKEHSSWHERPYNGEMAVYADGGISLYAITRVALEHIYNYTSPLNPENISRTYIFEDLMIALILKHYMMFPKRVKDDLRNLEMKNLLKEKIKEGEEEKKIKDAEMKKKEEEAEVRRIETQRKNNELAKHAKAVK